NLLEDFLYSSPFEEIFRLENINDKVSLFNQLMVNIFDTLAPIRKRKNKKINPPWLTDNIKLLIKLRDKALSKYRTTKRPAHYQYYKDLKNFTTVAIRNEKRGYFNFCLNTYGRNSKQMWQQIRKLDIRSKPANREIPQNLDNPNNINNHFLLVTGNMTEPDQNLLLFYNNNLKTNFNELLNFITVNTNTVYKYLLEIKTKAVGVDELQIDMLLLCCPYILPFITNIVNTCIELSVFPDEWKISKVFPLPKKSNITSMSELRPISILSVLSKV
uniref:Uncharacterized protein LOC114346988 n=1 Tax=Diabrotica virgifera virgifera TaxID=50390 RepID=A0A6P7HCJ9_DIAVI